METQACTTSLIIDLQNDFTLDKGKVHACTYQLQSIIEKINQTVEQRNKDKALTALITTQWSNPLVRLLTKNSVKPGSFEAEVDARVSNEIKDHFIKPGKNIFTSKEFVNWLEMNEVEGLIFSGLALEHCIIVSVNAAIAQGYTVFLLPEGLASYKCGQREKYLLKLERIGAKLHVQ
ncbi:MAG: cysteine hydrolase [Gammaproteobacteria bacterium]|nr:cysteine hydrolase [Gammaproteobacteria bacterium]